MAFGSSCGLKGMVISVMTVCLLGTFAEAQINIGSQRPLTIPTTPTTPAILLPVLDPYDGLGTFSCLPPFLDPVQCRLACVPPEPRTINETRFCFLNRNNTSLCTPIGKDNVPKEFNASKCTIFVIHGYSVKNDTMTFVVNMTIAIAKKENCNVIFVNWTCCNGATTTDYPQALANGRLVGAIIWNLIKVTLKINEALCHIVGHSLGAHVAGWCGERFNGSLGKITGLDPAGPFFHNCTNARQVCLDKTDAQNVIVLHTNAAMYTNISCIDGYGSWTPFGHFDCYANNGSIQPGCQNPNETSVPFLNISVPVQTSTSDSCSHRRAVLLLEEAESNTTCAFKCYQCPSYENLKNGICKDNTFVVININTTKPPPGVTVGFLQTSDSTLFCIEP